MSKATLRQHLMTLQRGKESHSISPNANALETILTSRDRVLGLQGLAGTGKTTFLTTLTRAAQQQGYAVEGFAPTGAAADSLGESGMNTATLQKFVARAQVDSDEGRKMLYVMDESSLADSRNMSLFFRKAVPNARLLLVGDTKQHQAVEAGAPFEQFAKAGMQVASLDEILRQKSNLKKPVEQLSKREILSAVNTLLEQGRITEIVDDANQLSAIAKDYLSNSKGTFVISPANKERVALNSIIHRDLQQQGLVSHDDHKLTILVNRQEMTGPERRFALAYVPGEDIIRYNRTSKLYGVERGVYGRVLDANHRDNTLTVKLESGREITYNPERLFGVSVYREAERKFASGDRIQFRAPFEQANVKNTELGTIRSIAGDALTVQLDKGRQVTVPLNRFRHFDHGYAVTSYSSQAQTVDRVLLNAETTETDLLLNQRMAYVALSRARLDAHVYTDSAANLGEALDRQQNKEIALEAFHESQQAAASITASNAANTQFPKPDNPTIKGEHMTASDITRAVIERSQLSVHIDPTSNLQQSTENSIERARQALDKIAAERSPETHQSTNAAIAADAEATASEALAILL